jgi:3-mercaptopyruvate sulfurtransferase SseA
LGARRGGSGARLREPGEFDGPLGHIDGAKLIPLGELGQDRPIVAACRAGSRSAQTTVILREAGFGDVANLPGGMLRWRAERPRRRRRRGLAEGVFHAPEIPLLFDC